MKLVQTWGWAWLPAIIYRHDTNNGKDRSVDKTLRHPCWWEALSYVRFLENFAAELSEKNQVKHDLGQRLAGFRHAQSSH